MPSAGGMHTVLLTSDGSAVAFGDNRFGQCDIPPLEEGISYTQVSAGLVGWQGASHTVLLKSDGTAVACGDNSWGQCDIPPLAEGVSCTHVSAGGMHTVLLKSDGSAVAFGHNGHGQCDLPPLEEGISYTQVSAGDVHTVLLKSDGTAVVCGIFSLQRIPQLGEGVSYTQVSAGSSHTVLLKSDGTAIACGGDRGDYAFPKLAEGTFYTEVSAGGMQTVLLKSDGTAVAIARDRKWRKGGAVDIPRLVDESYIQVSAGGMHTVLLRSDGTAVACGDNSCGQCAVPSGRRRSGRSRRTEPRQFFVQNWQNPMHHVTQIVLLDFAQAATDDQFILTCSGLSGREMLRLTMPKHHRQPAWDVYQQLARDLHIPLQNLQLVLPDGQLLARWGDASISLANVACRCLV